MLHVSLHFGVREFTADKTLRIEDGVLRVHGDLVLGGVTDETLGVSESNKRWGGSVALVICNWELLVPSFEASNGKQETY